MISLDKLTEINHWWKTGNINKELSQEYKRNLFFDIKEYIKLRQIIAIVGLRRTGKTTIFYQIIEKLINEKIDTKNILYFSFDETVEDIRDIITAYQENILKKDLRTEKIFIFLDEIQKLEDWQNKIKIYYDLYPKIKFFISGSASLNILIKAKESLAGRIFYFNLEVLSFEEFLNLKGQDIKKIEENVDLWKLELNIELNNYLLKPFPEIVNVNDEIAKRYIRESVIEKAIFRDLNSLFEIKDIELIEKIIHILANKPGMIVNLEDLARDLNRTRQIISNYFYYLECCFIVKSLRNFRGSYRVSSRKLKKYYLTHPCISLALASQEKSRLIESLVQFKTKADYFWRKNDKEVDFIILKDKEILPIEVKESTEITKKELRHLIFFMKKFSLIKSILIYNGEEEDLVINNYIIKKIPLWKFCILKDYDQ